MRRVALWIGIGAVVVGYLTWTVTRSPQSSPSARPITSATTAPTAEISPFPTGPSASPTPTSAASPTLLFGTGRVTRGQVVAASGFGFLPKEKLRVSRLDQHAPPSVVATGQTDEHGSFAGLAIRIADTWPNGRQTFVVEGVTSHRQATATFDLEGSPPGAEPTTYSGKPLTEVSFSGGGFSANEEVDVYFDTLASPILGRFHASAIGVVQVTAVTVPMAAPGQHAFLLVGRRSGAPVRVPFSVLPFTPWIGLTNYTPQPEQPVGVLGHDFARGETVAIFLDSPQGRPVAQAVVDRQGTFTVDPAVVVPYDRRGKVNLVAVGTMSQIAAVATMTVRPYAPIFELSRYAGPPGTAVTVTGRGFARNETVRVQFGDSQHPIVVVTRSDDSGRLNATAAIQIPRNLPAGKVPVTALGEHSQEPASVTFAVTPLSPWLSPVPAAGPVGTHLTFDGGGFAPDELIEVSIQTSAGSALATTFTTDDTGGLHRAGALMIPTAMAGQVSLQAVGTQSGARASATFTIIPASRPAGRLANDHGNE